MKAIRKILRTVIVLAVIAVIGIAGFWLVTPDKSQRMPYRTEALARGTIAQLITATGTINPEEVVTVGTQVSGKITATYVKVNDEVKKGQLLAEIDPSIPLTQLKQSKASLETAKLAHELAQRDYERTRALVSKEYVAKVEMERSWQSVVSTKNALESAKIQVERDEVNLSYTKVTSPIDGMVIWQEASSGQTVASNFQTPNLFRIARDMRTMKIDMNMPEADISKIHEGMKVDFTVDAFEGRAFTGVVKAVDINPNNQSGVVTYTASVTIDNSDRALFPGMTANISITLSETKNVLRIPAAALRFSPPVQYESPLSRLFSTAPPAEMQQNFQGMRVYVWRNNQAVMIPIETGASDDFYFELKKGDLKEGDAVITGLSIREE